ncbi:MAG: hypothetical protein J6K85_04235 [Clostridia bacterium]|nr:hypothetical protein [Clostridia bacterium]
MKNVDYEILHYIVQYHVIFDVAIYEQYFDTEEAAIAFIEAKHVHWMNFRLLKLQYAPEYTHKFKQVNKYE